MELIKTRYKSLPNKGFTHSLGAKAISECLIGCENYSVLQIGFDNEEGRRIGLFVPGWTLRKIKGSSNELLSFRCIISIRYSESLDEWNLSLYPTKINKSKSVKSFLIQVGLPNIKKWLNTNRSETWFSGHRYLQIGIDETLNEYCVFETRNDRIIEKKINKIKVPNNV